MTMWPRAGPTRWPSRVDRVDGPEPVDPRHALDELDVLLGERAVVRDARVGDDEIEPAGLLDEPRDGGRHLLAIADVGGQRHGPRPELAGQPCEVVLGTREPP
jgi:hypothetical protein